MPAHPAPAPDPSDFTVADASLHRLATLVNEASDDPEPSLVRTVPLDDGRVEVGFAPLGGHHPATLLTGFDAPADWDAIGVVTTGRSVAPDAPSRTTGRAVVTAIVSRRGEIASSVSLDGGEQAPGPTSGLMVDLLQRSLRLPTEPPPCSTGVYFAARWLCEAVAVVEDTGRTPTWDELVRLHPAMRTMERDGVDTADFVTVARAFERVASWSRLRRMVDDGKLSVEGLRPGDGAWFDDGGFARLVLCTVPRFRALRRRVRRALPTRLARRVSATLGELGVPSVVWPELAPDADRRPA